MKTSILQSMLAKNKSVINEMNQEMNSVLGMLKRSRKEISTLMNEGSLMSLRYIKTLQHSDIQDYKRVSKLKKSLAQYAIIQKAIKDEIKGSGNVVAWDMANGSSISFKSIYYDE